MGIASRFQVHPVRVWKNLSWRATRRTSQEPHVFVVGAPRSGTTLMQVILASHARLCSFEGESALFTWQDLFKQGRRHMNLEPDRLQRLFDECSDVVQFFDRAAQVVKRRAGAPRFVEKTPQHVLKLGYIQRHFPNAQVVHLYRDGRDGYCSARKAAIPHGEGLRDFAQYWQRCVWARGSRGSDPRILDVKYEDLTSDPEREVRRVMAFLGEEFLPEQIDPEARARDKRSDEEQFARLSGEINARSQGRWKKEFTVQERARFARIAGRELQHLGYSV